MRVLGHIDAVSEYGIDGWALVDGNIRFTQGTFDVVVDDQVVGSVTPKTYRDDLRRSGKGDGHFGFQHRFTEKLAPGRHKFELRRDDSDETISAESFIIPLPEDAMRDHAGDAFVAVGNEFVSHLQKFCGLTDTSSVLDMGCGSGRMAIPLAKFLKNEANYRGFDVFEPAIRWCQENIQAVHPAFRFDVADVANALYRSADGKASEYVFPYEDESFDVALAASLFTHLLPSDFSNYFRQLARVLKPGGKALVTAYLINPDARYLIERGKTKLYTFRANTPPFHAENESCPEEGLAYDEDWVLDETAKAGLSVEGGVRYGMWCGREQFLSYQDVLILAKS